MEKALKNIYDKSYIAEHLACLWPSNSGLHETYSITCGVKMMMAKLVGTTGILRRVHSGQQGEQIWSFKMSTPIEFQLIGDTSEYNHMRVSWIIGHRLFLQTE